MLWGIGAKDEREAELALGDRIAGLRVNPLNGNDASGRPRIEEIE